MALSLVTPALGAWHRQLRADWQAIPRPLDEAGAHALGPAPSRVLIVGSGPATGWGVLSHDLALPGHLARRLGELTDRGVDVDLVTTPFMSIAGVQNELVGQRLWRYDAVVVVLGVPDVLSLTPVHEWRERLDALLDRLTGSCVPECQIIVAGIQPIRSIPGMDSVVGSLLDTRARRFNASSQAITRDRPRARYVPFGVDPALPWTLRYREWAESIAESLQTRLSSTPSEARTSAGSIGYGADEEAERQADLDRMGVVGRPGAPAVQRIAALAREAFGTRYAAVTLLDQERQSYKAMVGGDAEDLPRAQSFCDITIRHNDALVIPDAREDGRFAGRRVGGPTEIRFYAGYPIESPGGYRIGALCVFDPDPRPDAEVDTSLLQSLAKIAQRELALEAEQTARDRELEPPPARLIARPRAARAR